MLNIPSSSRVAVLIDADNIQLKRMNQILKFTADNIGNITICRAYGDWKKPPLIGHQPNLKELSVQLVQVNRMGKDSTDKQLMIEAAEILGKQQVDVFVIVSGDGDFRPLCLFIKQVNSIVIGVGNKYNTSQQLPSACHAFYYINKSGKVVKQ